MLFQNSGQRLKDFIDIYYILERYPLSQLLKAYQTKYSHSNPIIALKAITYFEDINPSIDPPIMKDKISLKAIKKRIQKAVESPQMVFTN